jgi:ribosomal-protein-alanine N-acetyltransferase
MTEACDVVTDYWFEVLRQPVLRVPKAIANEASRRISVQQGMRIVSREERDYVSGRLPSGTWEITVEEWRRRKQERLANSTANSS